MLHGVGLRLGLQHHYLGVRLRLLHLAHLERVGLELGCSYLLHLYFGLDGEPLVLLLLQ